MKSSIPKRQLRNNRKIKILFFTDTGTSIELDDDGFILCTPRKNKNKLNQSTMQKHSASPPAISSPQSIQLSNSNNQETTAKNVQITSFEQDLESEYCDLSLLCNNEEDEIINDIIDFEIDHELDDHFIL